MRATQGSRSSSSSPGSRRCRSSDSARWPALNYLKFLELMGFELLPARPATVEVTFPVRTTHTSPTLIVPRLTQIATAKGDELGPIIFETERSLVALRAAPRFGAGLRRLRLHRRHPSERRRHRL